ncbi:MAG: secretin N-terminal domain-containing protein [Chlamydiota bacterium]
MTIRYFLPFLFPLYALFADPGALSSPLSAEESRMMNEEIAAVKKALREKCAEAWNVSEEEHGPLLEEIRHYRSILSRLEKDWQQRFARAGIFEEEGCGIWDPGELTLSQLILEYGSNDFLYVIPPEMMNSKLQIFSSIPLPRESWDQMVKLILHANGIGVKPLSSYAKKLYFLKQDLSMVESLCKERSELEYLESGARTAYIFAPPPEQVKALQNFFTRFSDPKETGVQIVGNKIVLVSCKENIEKLLSLYDAIWEKNAEKVVRVVSMRKIDIPQAEQILKAFFPDPGYKGKIPIHSHLSDELIFISISQGLVLIGNEHAITRAETVLADLENQLEDPYEMTVYWYSCKHSNPEDIADVLSQVYESLLQTDGGKKPLTQAKNSTKKPGKKRFFSKETQTPQASQRALPIEGNFIVDPKTGAILMVIRKDQIPKIKALLQKIDVPKKMVQIDVLLVEKRTQDQKRSGINLLKIGSNAIRNAFYTSFDGSKKGGGLLDFVFAHSQETSQPIFGNHRVGLDLTYQFLMTQQDLKINANPSVLAVNQTPAVISIVEEISINNGAVILDASSNNPRSERSFTRAQYGTVLKMTPTIHYSEEEEEGFITLVTDINFDTTQSSSDNRPPVTKRSVKNEVTVADGETIILGGLRQTTSENTEEKIPFIGDIPGLGKLFSMTEKTEYNKEMFIFITPKIVKHPVKDLRKIRSEELKKRAGDLPEFLTKVSEAKDREKKKLFSTTMDRLFSRGS